jgi:hypothetical protein
MKKFKFKRVIEEYFIVKANSQEDALEKLVEADYKNLGGEVDLLLSMFDYGWEGDEFEFIGEATPNEPRMNAFVYGMDDSVDVASPRYRNDLYAGAK